MSLLLRAALHSGSEQFLSLVRHLLFCMNYIRRKKPKKLYKKKEARAMGKSIFANIPHLRVKSQA
jgi:hypothetical protein